MDPEIQSIIQKITTESDPFVKARLIAHLTKEKNIRVKDLAKELKTTSSYLCNIIRVIQLPEIVRDGYYTKNVTLTHLLVLSRLHSIPDIVSVYETILRDSLPVAGVEALVREKLYGVSSKGDRLSQAATAKIEVVFKKVDPSLDVSIVQTRIKATLKIVSKGNLAKTTQALTKITELELNT